jgi:disulfide oxidoreductase YuzD
LKKRHPLESRADLLKIIVQKDSSDWLHALWSFGYKAIKEKYVDIITQNRGQKNISVE